MSLWAADVSGKWSGSLAMANPQGETDQHPALLIFKQNGAEITGSAGPDDSQQWPILKGKIEGNRITFEVQSDGPLYKADLLLTGDQIKGEVTVQQEGQPAKGKLELTRIK